MSSALSDRGMGEFRSPRNKLSISTDLQRNSALNATLATTDSPKPSLKEPSTTSFGTKTRMSASAIPQPSWCPSGASKPC
jgi:hypothetical protein